MAIRLLAFVLLILGIAGVLFGRVGHHTPVAIAGYALLALAILIGLTARR